MTVNQCDTSECSTMASFESSTVDDILKTYKQETPVMQRRSYGSSCSSSLSPETEEFESLEKSFKEELEQKLQERKVSESGEGLVTRRLSELSGKMNSEDDPMSLQLVEKRQLRSFSRADEYLYAMKEDLAEWLNMMYPHINIDAENFMDCLQTGEHLLKVSFLFNIFLNNCIMVGFIYEVVLRWFHSSCGNKSNQRTSLLVCSHSVQICPSYSGPLSNKILDEMLTYTDPFLDKRFNLLRQYIVSCHPSIL